MMPSAAALKADELIASQGGPRLAPEARAWMTPSEIKADLPSAPPFDAPTLGKPETFNFLGFTHIKARSYGRWCRGTSRTTLCPPTPDA